MNPHSSNPCYSNVNYTHMHTHTYMRVYKYIQWKSLSHVWLFVTPLTLQAMKFSRPEYWSGLPCPSPEDLPNRGIEPVSLLSPALSGWFFTTRATRAAPIPELLIVLKIMIVVIGEVFTVCQTQCQEVTSALSHWVFTSIQRGSFHFPYQK